MTSAITPSKPGIVSGSAAEADAPDAPAATYKRSVDEWRGATPEVAIPPRVRLRVFERHGGVCHISGRKIRAGEPWDIDHVVALCNGGEHRESNMAPALRDKHRQKTARDVAERAKIDRIRKRQLGIRSKSRFPGARDSRLKKKITGEVVERWT